MIVLVLVAVFSPGGSARAPSPPPGYDYYAEATEWSHGSGKVTVKVVNDQDRGCTHTELELYGYDRNDSREESYERSRGLFSHDLGEIGAHQTKQWTVESSRTIPTQSSVSTLGRNVGTRKADWLRRRLPSALLRSRAALVSPDGNRDAATFP